MEDLGRKLTNKALKHIRKRREELGLTQAAIAAHAGVNPSYIGLIERGERRPTLDKLAKMGRAVGLTPAELFAAASPKPTKEIPEVASIRSLLQGWERPQRRAAVRVLQEMDKIRSR